MAFRYRLRPDTTHLPACERHCADARFVWNLALEQANWYRPRRPTPGSAERNRQLAEARRESWLGDGSLSVQQQALRDFDRALRNWWSGTHRRPAWRKKGVHDGFAIRDVKVRRVSRKWAEVHVPKVGWVPFRLTRPLGAHGMARVTNDRAGRWHVSFSAPQSRLVAQHDLVVFEDLRVKDMLRSARGTVAAPGRNVRAKAGLNRRIAASAWSTLVRRTTQKAVASKGCEVVLVDPRHTSQRCSVCDHVHPGNRRSQAVFSCLDCGHADNADVNAAKNILAAGLVATARGGRPDARVPGEARTTRSEAA
jgi:transposase